MSTIQLNGKPYPVVAAHSVRDLVDELDLGNRRYAIEINGSLVPRSTYAQHRLVKNDQVEIVQAIGGG